MSSKLQNPIWTALTTGSLKFSTGNENLRFIQEDMGFFAGMPSYQPEDLESLSESMTTGKEVILFTSDRINPPAALEVLIDRELLQMVCEKSYLTLPSDPKVEFLTEQDIPEMLALTDLTKPGPFLPRTFDFGGYLGIKKEGKLASMAGYRLRPVEYTEISAVCTHPDYLGQGLSKKVMSQLLKNLQAEGQIPFLHLYANNYPALSMYESLGFVKNNLLRVYRLAKR